MDTPAGEDFYEKDFITYLSDENEQEISRAFIVADPGMVKFHFVDKVYEQPALKDKQVDTAIYSEVLPDPPLSQAIKIAKQMKKFAPDTIIAIGGGSALDVSKIARYIYEYSLDQEDGWLDIYDNVSELIKELQQKFVDIRKRIVKFKHETRTSLVMTRSLKAPS